MLPDQAAGAIAALAMQHARDEKYMSPYIVEAARQGFELGFWEKLTTASFEDGQLKLGTLRVHCPLDSRLCMQWSCLVSSPMHAQPPRC